MTNKAPHPLLIQRVAINREMFGILWASGKSEEEIERRLMILRLQYENLEREYKEYKKSLARKKGKKAESPKS